MSENNQTGSSVICGLRYRNAAAAIDWLCNVLGFARHAVYPGPEGTIQHAELTLGGGMIMLGSVRNNEPVRYMTQPDEIGGMETRSEYLVVPDADAVYKRVKESGVQIIREIENQNYGGRDFTCRDPEGHIWSVGTYDPWKAK